MVGGLLGGFAVFFSQYSSRLILIVKSSE
jgi:hypothetical protein